MVKMVGVVLAGMVLLLAVVQQPEDKVVFLDVGQGDAVLLQDGSRQVLVDGGPGMGVLAELGRELPWFDRRIEVVVLTHPQRDHMEGLLHVLERYEVGLVVLPAVAHTSVMQEKWLGLLAEHEVPYRFGWAGQELVVGDMRWQFLGPFDDEEGRRASKADLNNASVMARVDFCESEAFAKKYDVGSTKDGGGGCLSLLLTGDAEERVERRLVKEVPGEVLDVDVFKAGHHGSNSSSTAELLAAASPALVAVSVGADNRFGHPDGRVLERLSGIAVYRTDEMGAVRLEEVEGQWLLSAAGK